MSSADHDMHLGQLGGEVIASLRSELARLRDLDLVVVFGSVARGEPRADSDVDLIVDGPHVRSVSEMMGLRGELIERLGRSVELLALDDALGSPEVLVGALRDGQVLRDRQGQWPRLLRNRERHEAAARVVYDTYPARRAAVFERLSIPASTP